MEPREWRADHRRGRSDRVRLKYGQSDDSGIGCVRFLGVPSAKLCLIKTVNRLSLMDNRLCLLNAIPVPTGAVICVSPDQPQVIVAGNGTAAVVVVVRKKLVFRDSDISADSSRKVIVFDLKNGVSDTL
jgi:hypothetical protein